MNQRSYDVVSKDGERISVKTTAKQDSGGHVSFNPRTLAHADRIMVLFMNTEEMQIEVLLDEMTESAKAKMSKDKQGKVIISTDKLRTRKPVEIDKQEVVHEARQHDITIRELESGTILLIKAGQPLTPAKRYLGEIAKDLGIGLMNSAGNPYTTRQLVLSAPITGRSGADLVRMLPLLPGILRMLPRVLLLQSGMSEF